MTAHTLQASSPQSTEGRSPLQPPATHQTADGVGGHATGRDVQRALALPVGDPARPYGLGMRPRHTLPLYARIAIERLENEHQLRTAAKLDELLQAYANFYRETVDLNTCASAHHICARLFLCFVAYAGTDAMEAPHA